MALCFEWYDGGTLRQPKKVVRPTTSASYKYYLGRYELKVKSPTGSRTYRGYGAPHRGWILNPYVKRTNKTSRTGNTRSGNSTNVLHGSKLRLRH